MAFASQSAVPITLPIVTWSQRESKIITREFTAVADGSVTMGTSRPGQAALRLKCKTLHTSCNCCLIGDAA